MSGDLEKRFRRKCSEPTATGCIEWLGWRKQGGYGMLRIGPASKGLILAHRAAYEIHYGKISDGKWVLHKCDNPSCVNVDHLFLGTAAANMADMHSKDRGRPSEVDFDRVFDLRKHGLTQREIAIHLGTTQASICRILSGRVKNPAVTQA